MAPEILCQYVVLFHKASDPSINQCEGYINVKKERNVWITGNLEENNCIELNEGSLPESESQCNEKTSAVEQGTANCSEAIDAEKSYTENE